jgi:hypothetical protein
LYVRICAQAIEPSTESTDDGEQVVHQLLFRGKGIPIHDQQVGPVPLAERREPLKAESHQPILMRDDEPADLSEFDLLHKAIELLALVIQPAANFLNPLVRMVVMPRTVVTQSRYLMRKIGSLPSTGHSRVHNRLPSSIRT